MFAGCIGPSLGQFVWDCWAKPYTPALDCATQCFSTYFSKPKGFSTQFYFQLLLIIKKTTLFTFLCQLYYWIQNAEQQIFIWKYVAYKQSECNIIWEIKRETLNKKVLLINVRVEGSTWETIFIKSWSEWTRECEFSKNSTVSAA